LTFNYFEGTALLGVQCVRFLYPPGNTVSLCKQPHYYPFAVIAESFLFASLKVCSFETQGLIKMQDKVRQRDVMPKASLFFPGMWAV